jgi:hypothetical protein
LRGFTILLGLRAVTSEAQSSEQRLVTPSFQLVCKVCWGEDRPPTDDSEHPAVLPSHIEEEIGILGRLVCLDQDHLVNGCFPKLQLCVPGGERSV